MAKNKRKWVIGISAMSLLLCLFVGVPVYKIWIQDNSISVHANDEKLVPLIYSLTGRSDGSYWDSSVQLLPCISVKPEKEVELIYQNDFPSKITVTKYDVLNENSALGARESRGEPENLELERREDGVSFMVPGFNTNYQLIRCCCTWEFLFLKKDVEFVFSLRNE